MFTLCCSCSLKDEADGANSEERKRDSIIESKMRTSQILVVPGEDCIPRRESNMESGDRCEPTPNPGLNQLSPSVRASEATQSREMIPLHHGAAPIPSKDSTARPHPRQMIARHGPTSMFQRRPSRPRRTHHPLLQASPSWRSGASPKLSRWPCQKGCRTLRSRRSSHTARRCCHLR